MILLIVLDDYIAQKGISKPNVNSNKNAGVDECDFGSSKFNRYNKEDEVYDDGKVFSRFFCNLQLLIAFFNHFSSNFKRTCRN